MLNGIYTNIKGVSLIGTSKAAGATKTVVGFAGHRSANGLRHAADGIDWLTNKVENGCDAVDNWALAKMAEMLEKKVAEAKEAKANDGEDAVTVDVEPEPAA